LQAALYIYSNHLLVRQEIEQVLALHPDYPYSVLPTLFDVPATRDEKRQHLLILDTYGLPHWAEIVKQWHEKGASTIIFIPPESDTQAEKLRMISLGTAGVLSVSSNWKQQLPLAIQSVIRGELWISRSVLGEYVKKTVPAILRTSSALSSFTPRERQIQNFRSKGCSNKQIANALGISERTVKFHVSNILQKSKASDGNDFRGNI
jgi:DNA-binding NarL/FixJ family response regulator